MRADLMVWVQRLVGLVFVIGLVALVAAVATILRQAEGVPPMPIYAGLIGAVALILLAGACLALISIAVSAKRGAEALSRLSSQGAVPTVAGKRPAMVQQADAAAAMISAARPFSANPIREQVKAPAEPDPEPAATVTPARPQRPAGRTLVAER